MARPKEAYQVQRDKEKKQRIFDLKEYTRTQHIALVTSYSQLENIIAALFAGESLTKDEKEELREYVTKKMQEKFNVGEK